MRAVIPQAAHATGFPCDAVLFPTTRCTGNVHRQWSESLRHGIESSGRASGSRPAPSEPSKLLFPGALRHVSDVVAGNDEPANPARSAPLQALRSDGREWTVETGGSGELPIPMVVTFSHDPPPLEWRRQGPSTIVCRDRR